MSGSDSVFDAISVSGFKVSDQVTVGQHCHQNILWPKSVL
jgi:hypothetical protein